MAAQEQLKWVSESVNDGNAVSMLLSETLNLKLNNKQIKMIINSGQEKCLEAWKD